MASKRYYLDKEKKDIIHLKWGYNWKNCSIIHNEKEIGSFKNKQELLEGNSFKTEDGREISIKLKNKFSGELEILLNGEILPGSSTDPKTIINTAFGVALFIGLLNILIGAIGYFAQVSILQNLGAGLMMMGFGVAITALAFGIKAKSMIALIFVNIIYFIDTVSWVYFFQEANANIPIAGLVFRVFLILILVRAIPAMKKLKKA